MKRYSDLKIAIIHDSLQYFGGAERVFVSLSELFPTADIFTSIIDWKNLGPYANRIRRMKPKTYFVQKIPLFVKHPYLFRYLLPVLWRQFNLDSYDLVISCSYSQMSHLVNVSKRTVFIIYSFAPPRHLYGYETDFPWEKLALLKHFIPLLNRFLIAKDRQAMNRATMVISESKEVSNRIWNLYSIQSKVIYPPVLFRSQRRNTNKNNYLLSVARLSRRKHIDLAIHACNALKRTLLIAGVGPHKRHLKHIAGPTIHFLGNVNNRLPLLYEHASAVVCCGSNEDFGLVPVESMSMGTPVIAYNEGGHKETVIDGKTGILFDELTPESVIKAIKKLDTMKFDPRDCKDQAKKFSKAVFLSQFQSVITEVLVQRTKKPHE